MNEAEIRAAIDRLPTSRTDAASLPFFYEERTRKGGNGVFQCRFAEELGTVWEIMESTVECHRPGNLSPWLWMSTSGCSYLFQEVDGQTIPCGDFRGFKEAVDEEKAEKELITKARATLTIMEEPQKICDKGWPFGNE